MARQKVPAGLPIRIAAAERLRKVLGGARFEPITAAELGEGRDRALANRLVTTALRRRGHIDQIISELLERGIPGKSGGFEAILRLALAQLVYLPEIGAHSAVFLAVEALKRDPKGQHLRGLLNAVLRRAQTNAARYWTLPGALLIPRSLSERWTDAYGASAVERFSQALLEGAPLDLTLKDEDPELVAAVGATPVMADTVRVTTRERAVEDLPGFSEGRWWVQDAAAAIPARLLKLPAGARVLDLCAAPGGKTAQLCKADYHVTAVDSDAARLERVRSNLDRLGYAAELVAADAGAFRPDQPVDAILLDAPCSATGTFRRHPEVLWAPSSGAPGNRVALQRTLLENAVEVLRPEGVLVYCVCSLEPEEGEEQAGWALANLQLAADPIQPAELPELAEAVSPEGWVRTHPGLVAPGPAGGTLDGFFVARFRKRPA